MDDKSVIYHRIIEALKFAFAQRPKLSDPLFHDVLPVKRSLNLLLNCKIKFNFQLIENLTSPETAEQLHKLIDDGQTFNHQHYNPSFSIETNFGTSHISIITANGDAVSVTSSINY